MKVEKYKHDLNYSYALGATLTYELLKTNPNLVMNVYVKEKTNETSGIVEIYNLCNKQNIDIEKNDKIFNVLSKKDNCYVIAKFKKEEQSLSNSSHIVLVNPSNAGNLGTILRTASGFNYNDIAIIGNSVDYYDPKVVRASMGAIFHLNIKKFNDINDYINDFPNHKRYAFMLQESKSIHTIKEIVSPYSLIFGNEATGLPLEYSKFCESIIIPHSNNIDSLNLPIASSIAMFYFTKDIYE